MDTGAVIITGETARKENARAVLERRYLIRDEHGDPVETVEELFRRVAGAIAAADAATLSLREDRKVRVEEITGGHAGQ